MKTVTGRGEMIPPLSYIGALFTLVGLAFAHFFDSLPDWMWDAARVALVVGILLLFGAVIMEPE